jgi:predicted dehydrogenase
MAEKKLKFGVLGFGSIGRRHYDNLHKMDHDVRFYDPIDPDPADANPYSRDDVIEWADAVLVCTPTGNHFQDMIDVLDHGKHCFVEKPIAYESPELVDTFMKTARSRWLYKTIIATGFNLHFHECVVRAEKILADDLLGEILGASFSVLQKSDKQEYLRDGVIRNWACHEIDLAMHLLGDLEVVDAFADVNAEGRDQASCSIDMRRDGIRGIIKVNADYNVEPWERFFWIKGKNGTLYCNLLERTMHIDFDNKGMAPYTYKGVGSFDKDYKVEMLHFANSCKAGKHIEPLAYGEEGVRNLYAIMKARKLARVT